LGNVNRIFIIYKINSIQTPYWTAPDDPNFTLVEMANPTPGVGLKDILVPTNLVMECNNRVVARKCIDTVNALQKTPKMVKIRKLVLGLIFLLSAKFGFFNLSRVKIVGLFGQSPLSFFIDTVVSISYN